MRPKSIVMFDRLFLASLVASLIGLLLGYGAMNAQWAHDTNAQRLGLGGGFLVAAAVFGLLLYLVLWFLIARKASNIAKWVLIVLLVVGLVSLPSALTGAWTLTTAAGLLSYALEIAAIAFLFKPDAKAWLKREPAADTAAFD